LACECGLNLQLDSGQSGGVVLKHFFNLWLFQKMRVQKMGIVASIWRLENSYNEICIGVVCGLMSFEFQFHLLLLLLFRIKTIPLHLCIFVCMHLCAFLFWNSSRFWYWVFFCEWLQHVKVACYGLLLWTFGLLISIWNNLSPISTNKSFVDHFHVSREKTSERLGLSCFSK